MSLPLTVSRVAAVYECLREFPPFSRWKLPRTLDVEFGVTKLRDVHADADVDGNERRLRVSEKKNGHFSSLCIAVAHEMVHLALRAKGDPNWDHHGESFQRYARLACRRFGWDWKTF